jgi:hypothetical protein
MESWLWKGRLFVIQFHCSVGIRIPYCGAGILHALRGLKSIRVNVSLKFCRVFWKLISLFYRRWSQRLSSPSPCNQNSIRIDLHEKRKSNLPQKGAPIKIVDFFYSEWQLSTLRDLSCLEEGRSTDQIHSSTLIIITLSLNEWAKAGAPYDTWKV